MKVNKKDFTMNPTNLSIPRSKFAKPYNNKLTFDVGQIVPIYVDEILPGDTVTMKMSELVRMQTPIFPVMDNAFIDTYFFFVPNRILWEHFEEFMGENKTGIWEQETEYAIPTLKMHSANTIKESGAPTFIHGDNYYQYGVQAGSLADYMGLPIVDANTTNPSWRGEYEVNALPFRAYYQIYNDWFRDENLCYPIEFDKGDATVTCDMDSADPEEHRPLLPPVKAAKFHDFFTSCLPEPQKGPDVTIPLGDNAPVVYGNLPPHFEGYSENTNMTGKNVVLGKDTANLFAGNTEDEYYQNQTKKGNNLIADLSDANAVTINALREAFAVQKYYEKLAMGGSRYTEIIKSLFGVTSSDARMQRAEYLGGARHSINIDQVLQTSETGSNTPQGNVAGYSLTTLKKNLFTKSFTEHGILMGVQVIRTEHSYQDGLNKMWSKSSKFDFYFPQFAFIGNQPVYNKELYLSGDVEGSKDDEAFGYQEAWAEYRYKPNEIHGEFRSKYHQSLDSWHWADNYGGLPSLSQSWIEQNFQEVNRTIAVTDQLANQFMADIWFNPTYVRALPVYSIPGLIDHM